MNKSDLFCLFHINCLILATHDKCCEGALQQAGHRFPGSVLVVLSVWSSHRCGRPVTWWWQQWPLSSFEPCFKLSWDEHVQHELMLTTTISVETSSPCWLPAVKYKRHAVSLWREMAHPLTSPRDPPDHKSLGSALEYLLSRHQQRTQPKTHIGVCQPVHTHFTLCCICTLYRTHSTEGVGSVQALKDTQRFAGCNNLFNLWLGPGMSTMRTHYRSRQHRLTLWQSVISHEQSSTARDNSHSSDCREGGLIFSPSGLVLKQAEESGCFHLCHISGDVPCQ